LEKFPDLKSFPFKISKLKETAHQEIYEKEISKSILDDINLFYVANTRPTEKLFLLVDKAPTKKSSSPRLPFDLLMQEFIQSSDMIELEENVFRMGAENSLVKLKDEEHTQEKMLILDIVKSEAWREIIDLSLENEREKSWNESAAWGQKVHLVLAEIHSKKDISSAFADLIYKGIIEEDEQEVLVELVLQVMNHPKLKAYYKSGLMVFNEREIMAADGKVFRPDRMVVFNDHVIIIDYKTGQPNEKDQKQVSNYMKLLASVLQKKTQGFLVYLHEEIIVEEV